MKPFRFRFKSSGNPSGENGFSFCRFVRQVREYYRFPGISAGKKVIIALVALLCSVLITAVRIYLRTL